MKKDDSQIDLDHKNQQNENSQSSQHSSQNTQRNNRSCQPIIEQDITESRNEKISFRGAKSQQILTDKRSNLQNMNAKEKQEYKKQITKKLIPISQPKIQVNTKGTNFDCQKVQSQQESYDGQSYHSGSKKSSQISLEPQNSSPTKKSRRYKKEQKLPFDSRSHLQIKQKRLNILVAGAQDTGKTTFIRCFHSKQKSDGNSFIRRKTPHIKYDGPIVDQNNRNTIDNIFFYDVPGFNQDEQNQYIRQIQKLYFQLQQKYQANPSLDLRIHCCLYFFRGPRIKESDLRKMERLSQIINLIPVLAKADQYTKPEILQIKQNFLNKTSSRIKYSFYDVQQYFSLKLGRQRENLIPKQEFGKYPPFAIASSQTSQKIDGNTVFVRKYQWGTLEIQNNQHNQLKKLRDILTNLIRQDLIANSSKPIRNLYGRQIQQERQNQRENIGQNLVRVAEVNVRPSWKNKLKHSIISISLVFAVSGVFCYRMFKS